MNRVTNILRFALLMVVASGVTACSTTEELRDPLLQPFSSESIWNMPIGTEAEYVPSGLITPQEGMVTLDEDYLFLNPDLPLVDVTYSIGRWSKTNIELRCVSTDERRVLARLPLPKDYIVSPKTWDGHRPNAGMAVLMQDRRYIFQGLPYAHCTEDGDFTLGFVHNVSKEDHPEGYVDIYGDGRLGAHGGSTLSVLGGVLRLHELTPDSGPIRHALKVNVCASNNLYYDRESECGYRWPAASHDDTAHWRYGNFRPEDTPFVEDCVLGALLALKPEFDKSQLRTEPARILAQAFIDYGAYIVDNTGWDVFALITERGPQGRFTDEFRKNWGFDFQDHARGETTKGWSDWAKDIRDIYDNLHVVANNTPENIGGPGERRVPKAAPLKQI